MRYSDEDDELQNKLEICSRNEEFLNKQIQGRNAEIAKLKLDNMTLNALIVDLKADVKFHLTQHKSKSYNVGY